MKVLLIVAVLSVLSVGGATIYYSHTQDLKFYAWLPQGSQKVHPGAEKANVRKFCEFLVSNRHLFDTYYKEGENINAEMTIDGIQYKFTHKPSLYVLEITIIDGGEILSIRDVSDDGTVDSWTRATYSYLSSSFVPEDKPISQTQFTEQMDYANRKYEEYLTLLMQHFNLQQQGHLAA